MAKREENIKKINEELEKLSDDELDKVAGGFYARSNGGDVKSDVNASNPEYTKQSRLIVIG